MQINTVTLAAGHRFFIVEDFFEPAQYNALVALFDEYTADHVDWLALPGHFRGRMVYGGASTTLTQLHQLACNPDTIGWISHLVGHDLAFESLSLWLDLPGYQVTPHCDIASFEYAVQIYVPDPDHFFEMMGTCVYTDLDLPLFEIHYRPNRGYLIDQTHTVRHGLHRAIPAGIRRQSVYLRYQIR